MDEERSNRRRQEYMARINRVLDYIERRIDKEMTLEELAGVAHFSPFHFHRVFKAMVGETLHRFIQRLRIEKAAARLSTTPGKTVTAHVLGVRSCFLSFLVCERISD